MKAVQVTRLFDPITGTLGKVEVVEVETPKVVADDDVLIRIAYAALCGSDIHYLTDRLFDQEPPFATGHEFSGVIANLGLAAQEQGFAIGDAVTGNFVLECGFCDACRSGKRQFCEQARANPAAHAEYILLNVKQVYHLPKDCSLLQAALIEPFTIAAGAMEKSGLSRGQSLLVLGAGNIGQMLVQLGRLSGASLVAASARTPAKRQLAMQLGADITFDPTKDDIEAFAHALPCHGFDVIIEASGNPACAASALDLVCEGGTVVYVSYYPPASKLDIDLFSQIVSREVTIRGLQLAQNNWPQALRLFNRIKVEQLISKVYQLEDAPAAFADQVAGGKLKLILDCGSDR